MNVQRSAANSGAQSEGAQATGGTQLTGDAFFGLLVAQLKSQDPFSPMNPTEFVGQLVQFNTLEQLIHIRQAVESPAAK